MYRRRANKLPEDPTFPTNLKELGYHIDTNDNIKSIDHGDYFKFFITNNDRYNEVQREAMHGCIRKEVRQRLTALNVPAFYLPMMSPKPPPVPTPYMPIHMTAPEALRTKKRIIVLVNGTKDDLGILAYRILSRNGGIAKGSVLELIRDAQIRAYKRADELHLDRDEEDVGFVVLNPGQLLFSHNERRAMTYSSWLALPRASAVHPPTRIHEQYNRIEGNLTPAEHVCFVFEKILADPAYVRKDAELFIIGIETGGDEVTAYLNKHPNRHSVAALALMAPGPVLPISSSLPLHGNDAFLRFLAQRARAWILSHETLGEPLANPTSLATITTAAVTQDDEESCKEVALFPMVSGGHALHGECVLSTAWGSVLDWFFGSVMQERSGNYENERLNVNPARQMDTLHLTPTEAQTW